MLAIRRIVFALLACAVPALPACRSEARADANVNPSSGAPAAVGAPDSQLADCLARIETLRRETDLGGAPAFDERRAEILGRARGEPVLWLRPPAPTPDDRLSEAARATRKAFADAPPFRRVRGVAKRLANDRAALRSLLLREGYLYSEDPAEALALVTVLDLPKLFDEPKIHLQRGAELHELVRTEGRFPVYRHADGRSAELLLGDRVAVAGEALEDPLHRDLRGLARELGFDRAKIEHRTIRGLVAKLRFGGAEVEALLDAAGAKLSLACFAVTKDERKRVEVFIRSDTSRRVALTKLHAAVDEQVVEALPFDRPKGEKTAERDGQLRPAWRFAYKNGWSFFEHDDESYPVFDSKGRPMPPQMCVDFVLDSYERASGTWFTPRGDTLRRMVGSFDFDAEGITNRRAVLAFEKFAEEHPKLFVHRRFASEERIPFGERARFFSYLLQHADDFRPGDVVAIQGKKADGLIHQHAILIEDTDPLTGFPDALADQMKRPRRRTWEGIMAEAPLRSLLYHVRPSPELLAALAREPAEVAPAGGRREQASAR